MIDTKTILPIALLLGSGVVGYVIYRKVTAPAPGLPPTVPGAFLPPSTEPGIAAKYGRFDIYLPTSGITDVISGLREGGTKQEKQVEVPVVEEPVDAPRLGLRIPSVPEERPYHILPYTYP